MHNSKVLDWNFMPYHFLFLAPGITQPLLPAEGLTFAQAPQLLDNLWWLFSLTHCPNLAMVAAFDPLQVFNLSSVLGMGMHSLCDAIFTVAVEQAWPHAPWQFSFAFMSQLCQLISLVVHWVYSGMDNPFGAAHASHPGDMAPTVLIHMHLDGWCH